MNVEDAAKLLDAFGRLIGAVVWPAAIVYLVIRFRAGIGDFVSALGEVTIKGGGFEASAKRKQDEAGAALVAAAVSRTDAGETPVTAATAAREAVQAVSGITSRTIRRIENSLILWVDDNPGNNNYERQALEALGIRFIIATSTESALKKMALQKFDAIISDMGRPPDSQAGYTLLEKIRSSGNSIPYIIYAGSRSPEHVAEAIRRGATGCTNQATEFFEIVVSALKN